MLWFINCHKHYCNFHQIRISGWFLVAFQTTINTVGQPMTHLVKVFVLYTHLILDSIEPKLLVSVPVPVSVSQLKETQSLWLPTLEESQCFAMWHHHHNDHNDHHNDNKSEYDYPGGKPMCPVEDQLCKPGEQDEPHHCDLRSIVMMIVVTMVIMMIIKPSTAFWGSLTTLTTMTTMTMMILVFQQIHTMTNDIDDE